MERVLNHSWQWVRDWVPPGLTAVALVGALVGLWFVMMETDRSVAGTQPWTSPRTPTQVNFRPAESTQGAPAAVAGPVDSAQASVETATAASECEGLQQEIDSIGVRIRASGKSRQGARFRTRLRELRTLYQEECGRPGTMVTTN